MYSEEVYLVPIKGVFGILESAHPAVWGCFFCVTLRR